MAKISFNYIFALLTTCHWHEVVHKPAIASCKSVPIDGLKANATGWLLTGNQARDDQTIYEMPFRFRGYVFRRSQARRIVKKG